MDFNDVQTSLRAWRAAPVSLACAVFVILCCGVAMRLAGAYPTEDNALFEYCGRAIASGKHMYVDIWDDKLPGIYYVNALWQLAFGERYALHTLAQILLGVLSGILLSRIFEAASLRGRHVAACALIAWLCIIFPLNMTETYALPLLLCAVLAGLRGSLVLCGTFIGLAAAFWIPSLLLVVPLTARLPSRPLARAAIMLAIAVCIPLGTIACVAGISHTPALVRTWQTYAFTPPPARLHHHLALLNRFAPVSQGLENLWRGLIASGVLSLLLLLLAVVRRPANGVQRFGLLWSAAMTVGAFTGTRFYAHYFIACVPALLFTIAAYSPWPHLTVFRSILIAFAVVMLGRTIALRLADDSAMRSHIAARLAQAARPAIAGRLTMRVDSYKPELYLALDPRLRSPYELVGSSQNAAFTALPSMQTPADVNVRSAHGAVSGSSVCKRSAQPWEMSVRSLALAQRFARCP